MKFLLSLGILQYFDKKTLRNIGIVFFVLIVFIMVCLLPAVKIKKALKVKLDTVENNVARSQSKIKDYPRLVREKEETAQLVNGYLSKLINRGEQTRLIGDISDLARQCDVTISSMRPIPFVQAVPEDFDTFFNALSYELKLESGYHAFGKFVNQLEQFRILINIEKILIEVDEDNKETHKITLFLTTYAKI